jgi:hypothetical protein
MFSSQSRMRTIQLRTCLATMQKGEQSVAADYNKMKGFSDEMAAARKPHEDDDFVSYVLAGLDQDYNSFVENITGKIEISLDALYSQLQVAKAWMELQSSRSQQFQSSVNPAVHGRNGYHGYGGGGRGGFDRGFGGCGEHGSSTDPNQICQLCKKTSHTMTRCWKCFDWNFTDEEKTGNNTNGPGYNVDMTWNSDIGATDHIMSELDKLVMREKYSGQEQINAANGGDMQIAHVGHSTLSTPYRNLLLKNVLLVPCSKKNLVCIHHFT